MQCTITLLGLVIFAFILYILRPILVPLSFGLLLAILLNPFFNRLQKVKVPKVIAIATAIITAIIFLVIIGYFLSIQVAHFSDQLPVFKKKTIEFIQNIQYQLATRFNLDMGKQNQLIAAAEDGVKPKVGQTLMTLLGSMEYLVLIPLYSFLFLFYKTLLLNFIYEVFDEKNSKEVGVVLAQTKGAIQSYMFGLLIEGIIVAILNSAALLILGVPYAVLLGTLGAIVNVLPFIGGIASVLPPLIIVTITSSGYQTQLWIIISYILIQFTDNHFLIPYIVSSRVKINALISIIIVLMGGAVWGIPGMFLSIPFIGILKLIFDRVPELKPWGKLLGDEIPTQYKRPIRILKRKNA